MVAKRLKTYRADELENRSGPMLSGSQTLDQQLARILTSIANLLLRNGYGFSRVNKLAKVAFVNAAKAIDAKSESRISIARIAAVTGLTRIDVSQLLRSAEFRVTPANEPLNRAEKVANGWISDARFCNERGEPKRLPFADVRNSFSSLVKKYSGDIPARAMLTEMKRLRMVRHQADDSVQLGRTRRTGSRITLSAMRAITPWVHFLTDIDKFGQVGDLTSNARKLELQFDSMPQVLAATREIENRRATFVESLRHLGSRPDGKARHQLEVSIALAIAASDSVSSVRARKRNSRETHERKKQK